MVDILKNEDSRMVVKLSENYVSGVRITTASIAENIIIIDVLHSGHKSKRFILTATEMNALADAWQQFQHTVQVAEELHEKHLDY